MKQIQSVVLFYFLCYLQSVFPVNYLVSQNNVSLTIKGVVLHKENKKPLANVSVLIPEIQRGVVTDIKGRFKITIPKAIKATLLFKCMGFREQIHTIDSNLSKEKTIIIELEEENIALSTVTVQAIKKLKKQAIGTKTFTKIEDMSLPVITLTKEEIEGMGSRRLDGVLQEITGIAMVPDASGGSSNLGVQIQGMDSSYTMVMIDGQPLIGRDERGNIDLSKISLNAIEKIEVIKGATGTIYGSNAMAGIINITTKEVTSKKITGNINAKYGSNSTIDLGSFFNFPIKNLSKSYISLAMNYFKTNGFDADYASKETTLPAYNSKGVTLKTSNKLTKKDKIKTRLIFNTKKSDNVLSPTGKNIQNDINSSIAYKYFFSKKNQAQFNYFFSNFSFKRENVNKQLEFYNHTYSQIEAISNFYYKKSNTTTGVGHRIDNSKATFLHENPFMKNSYVFIQGDIVLAKNLNSIVGLRYDNFNTHPNSITSQLGFNYKPITWLTLKVNYSTGYKVPDFRKSFMAFNNGAYIVIGSSVLKQELEMYENQGLLKHNLVHDEYTKQLLPESSKNFNLGISFKYKDKGLISFGTFYNKIDNLIIEGLVDILKEKESQIYSYKNIKQAYTAGVEVSGNYKFLKNLNISFGYQYLDAKSIEKLEEIKQGNLEIRNNQGFKRIAVKSDYFNLPFRSKHTANCKLFYSIPHLNTRLNLRANFHGKYGIQDSNFKNDFIDQYDLFVKDYTLLNASIEKSFFNDKFQIQLTTDNLLNYTNKFIPNLIGRQFFTSLKYNF